MNNRDKRRSTAEDTLRILEQGYKTKFKREFRKIVFAIYAKNDRFIKPFIREFGELNLN